MDDGILTTQTREEPLSDQDREDLRVQYQVMAQSVTSSGRDRMVAHATLAVLGTGVITVIFGATGIQWQNGDTVLKVERSAIELAVRIAPYIGILFSSWWWRRTYHLRKRNRATAQVLSEIEQKGFRYHAMRRQRELMPKSWWEHGSLESDIWLPSIFLLVYFSMAVSFSLDFFFKLGA